MLKPYPYQEDILSGIQTLLTAGVNRPAVVAATGLGKTLTLATLIDRHVRANPRERAVVLVHRHELAEQARDEIHQLAPHLRPGIVMANQNDYDRQVVVASVPTLAASRMVGGQRRWRRREQLHSVGLVIADECHHAAAPSWRETLAHLGAWHGVPTVGFTATMHREGPLGLGEVWQQIVQRPDGGVWDTLWGVRHGYLCDVRGIRIRVPDLDLSSVHLRAGDLDADEMAGLMLNADTGAAIVKSIHEFAPERRGTVMAPNVETATGWAQEMNDAGIPTGVILGTTPKDERARIYRKFRDGELTWLTNNLVLTEGWNAPWCDAILIARLTKNPALYIQMAGRGLRRFAGKQDCLIMDVCGVTDHHGLASLTDLDTDRKIKPRDGQSLLEALDEFEDTPDDGEYGQMWSTPDRAPVHRVVGTEIDMFGNSHSVWLKTQAGTWFVPAADRLFFLWPQPDGRFSLGHTTKIQATTAVLVQPDLDIGIGMALAEQHAEQYAPDHAGKNAPWRQTGPARPGQKREMELWGLKPKRNMSAAQAYDALNVVMASTRLDPK